MGKFEVTGKVTNIFEQRNGTGFTVQEIELLESNNYNGVTRENVYRIGFTNQKMAQLNSVQIGQIITVEGYIGGRKRDNNEGKEFYNVNLSGNVIKPFIQQQQQQQGYYTNPANGAQYPYAPQTQQQQTYQQQAPYGQQQPRQGNGYQNNNNW